MDENKEIITVQPNEVPQEVSPLRMIKGIETTYRKVDTLLTYLTKLEEDIAELKRRVTPQNFYPERSETLNNLLAALSKTKLSANKYIRSNKGQRNNFGSLDDMRDAYEEAMAENDLNIIFSMQERNEEWVLVSRLMHSTGEWIECISKLNPEKETIKDPDQALAASLTSQKRYAFAMLLGIRH
jgi:hypothetical protein